MLIISKYKHGINNTHNYKLSPDHSQSYWLLRYLHWILRIAEIYFNVHGLLIYYIYIYINVPVANAVYVCCR